MEYELIHSGSLPPRWRTYTYALAILVCGFFVGWGATPTVIKVLLAVWAGAVAHAWHGTVSPRRVAPRDMFAWAEKMASIKRTRILK